MGLNKRRSFSLPGFAGQILNIPHGEAPWWEGNPSWRARRIFEGANILTFADEGCKNVLTQCRTNWNSTALKLHLFTNNITPSTSDVLGSYSEATFTGYAAVSITTWTAPAATAHVASMQADSKTFTRTATGTTQNIYGYYVTDNASTTLLWAERDPNAPIPITNNGDTYTVTPRITEQDLST